MDERTIQGKKFAFVGGSQGVGRAAALELARRGASLLFVGRNNASGADVVAQALANGAASAVFLALDISTIAGIRAAAKGIQAWAPALDGLVHSAITPFSKKTITADGLELGFAVQYFARAALNRLLSANLAASGDGRVVHITADVLAMAQVDLDDLQFEHRKWSPMNSVMGGHYLSFLHLHEAAQRFSSLPIALSASCIESTKTQSATDPNTPWLFRFLGRFGTTPELAARNTVTFLTVAEPPRGATILPTSKQYTPQPLKLDTNQAAKLWELTTKLALEKGLPL